MALRNNLSNQNYTKDGNSRKKDERNKAASMKSNTVTYNKNFPSSSIAYTDDGKAAGSSVKKAPTVGAVATVTPNKTPIVAQQEYVNTTPTVTQKAEQQTTQPVVTQPAVNQPSQSYVPSQSAVYTPVAAPEYIQSQSVTDAYNYLQSVIDNAPGTFASDYTEQLNSLYDQIINRKDFSYDINQDALYDQYARQYAALGQQAMADTTGQVAALTGGYGNSYAQTAGQQAYNSYLNNLNNIAPELYSAAYDRYLNESNSMLNDFNTVKALYDDDYSKYRDEYSDYQSSLQNAYNAYQDASDIDYNRYLDQLNQFNYEQGQAYQTQQDAIAQQNYEREFAYQQEQDALAQKNYLAELEYQKQLDQAEAAQKSVTESNGANSQESYTAAQALAYNGYYEDALGTLANSYTDYNSWHKAAVGMGIPEKAIEEYMGLYDDNDYEKLDTNVFPGGLFGKK